MSWTEGLGSAEIPPPPPPATLAQLRNALIDEWNNIPMRTVNALVNSIQRRIRAATAARGGHTRYWFSVWFWFQDLGGGYQWTSITRDLLITNQWNGTFVPYMYRFVIIIKYLTNFFKLEWKLGIKFTLRFFFLSVYETWNSLFLIMRLLYNKCSAVYRRWFPFI